MTIGPTAFVEKTRSRIEFFEWDSSVTPRLFWSNQRGTAKFSFASGSHKVEFPSIEQARAFAAALGEEIAKRVADARHAHIAYLRGALNRMEMDS
jgi:hypothetical protein